MNSRQISKTIPIIVVTQNPTVFRLEYSLKIFSAINPTFKGFKKPVNLHYFN
jgi:hypothetical protein